MTQNAPARRLLLTVVALALVLPVVLAGPGAPAAQAYAAPPIVTVPTSILGGAAAIEGTAVATGAAGAGLVATGAVTVGLFAAGVGGFYLGNKVIGPWLFSGSEVKAVVVDTGSGYPTAAWTTPPVEDPQCAAINCKTLAFSTSISRNSSLLYLYDHDTANTCTTGAGVVCTISAGGGVGTAHSVTYPATGYTGTGGTAPKLMSVRVGCYNAAGTVEVTCAIWKKTAQTKFTVTCRAPAGVTASGSMTLPAWRPGVDATPTTTLPGCDTILPNSHVDRVTATEVVQGSSSAQQDVPISVYRPFPDGINVSGGTYADCTYSAGSTYCRVELFHSIAGTMTSCLTVDCTGWKTNQVTSPSLWECRWGTHVMPITDCGFWPDSETTVEPAPTSTTTGSNPRPNATAPAGGPTFEDDPNDATGNDCMGDAWGWNPVNWVYVPVKCALTWAFVPPDGLVETKVATAQDEFVASDLGLWVTEFGEIEGAFDSWDASGDCAGPTVSGDLEGIGWTLSPLSTCSEPMQSIAVLFRGLLSLMVVFGAIFMVIKLIAAAMGLHVDTPSTWEGNS